MIYISCVIVSNGWYHCGIAVHLIYFFWSWLGRILLPRFDKAVMLHRHNHTDNIFTQFGLEVSDVISVLIIVM
jgi:hypothetical protein